MQTERLLIYKINNLKKSVLLLGPRQTGKSTLMRALKPEIEINLADQEQFLRFISKWSTHQLLKVFFFSNGGADNGEKVF